MLPEDLIREILIRLPPKSLVRFSCLSKLCLRTLADPQFFHLHLRANTTSIKFIHQVSDPPIRLQLMSFPDFRTAELEKPEPLLAESETLAPQNPAFSPNSLPKIVGSCNGLLCIANIYKWKFGLLNPSIRRLKVIPFPKSPEFLSSLFRSYYWGIEFGFGYDSLSNDFKVVSILYNRRDMGNAQVSVCSLKTDSWKVVKDDANPISPCIRFLNNQARSLVLNGAIYWVVYHTESDLYCILKFDFIDEDFKEITLPSCFIGGFGSVIGLGEVGGELCLLACQPLDSWADDDQIKFSVILWAMMEDYNWKILYKFELDPLHSIDFFGMKDEYMVLRARKCPILDYEFRIMKMKMPDCVVSKELIINSSSGFSYTPSLALFGEENQWSLEPVNSRSIEFSKKRRQVDSIQVREHYHHNPIRGRRPVA